MHTHCFGRCSQFRKKGKEAIDARADALLLEAGRLAGSQRWRAVTGCYGRHHTDPWHAVTGCYGRHRRWAIGLIREDLKTAAEHLALAERVCAQCLNGPDLTPSKVTAYAADSDRLQLAAKVQVSSPIVVTERLAHMLVAVSFFLCSKPVSLA